MFAKTSRSVFFAASLSRHLLVPAVLFMALFVAGMVWILDGLLMARLPAIAQDEIASANRAMLLGGFLGIVLTAGMLHLRARKISRNLKDMQARVVAAGNGDLNPFSPERSCGEISELASAFNRMVANFKTSREKLEQTVVTLQAAQAQAIQGEKLAGIGEFVSGVAHELNNPLTSVIGFGEMLQQGELPEQQRRYLDVILKGARRCQKIVQSLLGFARRQAPERKVVSANEIVESAVEILGHELRTAGIEVTTHLDPALPPCELDAHQMRQVFLNLINNARQAMEGRPNPGSLHIRSEFCNGRVRVIFKDNGPGISAENLKRIFNPFFTTKPVGKGSGLGLSVCYGIVAEHGGFITPESKPGEGATFTIDLPASTGAAVKIDTAPAAIAFNIEEGGGKRVLVIDDEDAILQMIREVLAQNGYKVDTALDGETALKRLGQYHYDLALCDLKMPGLNGQQVYDRLAATNPEICKRFIFITGDVVNEKLREFLRGGNRECLTKPFTLGDFRSAISRVSSNH